MAFDFLRANTQQCALFSKYMNSCIVAVEGFYFFDIDPQPQCDIDIVEAPVHDCIVVGFVSNIDCLVLENSTKNTKKRAVFKCQPKGSTCCC